MGGVFITEGMGLRIPAGGLVVSLDGGPQASAVVQVNLDMYPAWLDVAIDHVEQAELAHAKLLKTVEDDDRDLKGEALREEMRASLVAMTASAFALDAFYGRVSDLVEFPAGLREAWKKNDTKRSAQIVETLKLGFELPGVKWQKLRDKVDEVFKYRDWAVHPPPEYGTPVVHPDLDSGVDWRFVAFRFPNARAATLIALRTIGLCLDNPKQANTEIGTWVGSASVLLQSRIAKWESRYEGV